MCGLSFFSFTLPALLRGFLCFPFEVLKSGFLTFGDFLIIFFNFIINCFRACRKTKLWSVFVVFHLYIEQTPFVFSLIFFPKTCKLYILRYAEEEILLVCLMKYLTELEV